ncbi:MAG: FliO/MopB family protein [Deltaproteobacteria bacterium]|nr:FliO/MopB family protein [Deltaproteobacteria bacterium]
MLTLLLNIAESQPVLDPAALPGSELSFGWMFVKVIVSMLLVSALAFLAIKYLIPKSPWMKNLQGSKIQVLEKVGIEPRKNLYLVQVAEKVVLVGSSEQGLSALLEFSVQDFQKKTFSVPDQSHEAKQKA